MVFFFSLSKMLERNLAAFQEFRRKVFKMLSRHRSIRLGEESKGISISFGMLRVWSMRSTTFDGWTICDDWWESLLQESLLRWCWWWNYIKRRYFYSIYSSRVVIIYCRFFSSVLDAPKMQMVAKERDITRVKRNACGPRSPKSNYKSCKPTFKSIRIQTVKIWRGSHKLQG